MDEGRSALLRFLTTDPRDVGCEQAWALIHVYAELVAAGHDPEETYPGIGAHFASCGPCDDDFQGLLRALRDGITTGPSGGTGLTDR